jgi:hypothetical protein
LKFVAKLCHIDRSGGAHVLKGIAAFVGLVLCAVSAQASTTARDILDRQHALDNGARRWSDRHQQLEVEVRAEPRAPRHLSVDVFDRKYPDSQQKTMAYFSAPSNVKGTAFLAVTRRDGPGDQWLYLPEARRARRIGGEARKQGFVGTDLTYHDLDLLAAIPSWTEADATATLRGSETIDGVVCDVIELKPQRPDIGYQRIDLWVGRDDLVTRRVEFYEAEPSSGWFGFGSSTPATPTRRIRQSDIRLVGSIPVPHRVEVETPDTGSTTTLIFTLVRFDQGLPDELFTQPALEWGSYH